MCCRYLLEESPELRPIVEAMNRSPLAGRLFPRDALRSAGEIRPADTAPVIASDRAGSPAVFPMKWGFTGRSLLINARSETAASRPTFREAWQSHRCAVPASCYFEWERLPASGKRGKTGPRYRLYQKDSAVLWLCGLYRMENGIPCFVILTREPGESIRFIHDRMPLILPGDLVSRWVFPETKPEELLSSARTDLLFEQAG